MLLAGITVGGLYLAFPVACSLAKKGARLGLVLTYVNFAGVCRIPMLAFEASIMGWKFTATRMAVSIPLVILTSELLGKSLERRDIASILDAPHPARLPWKKPRQANSAACADPLSWEDLLGV